MPSRVANGRGKITERGLGSPSLFSQLLYPLRVTYPPGNDSPTSYPQFLEACFATVFPLPSSKVPPYPLVFDSTVFCDHKTCCLFARHTFYVLLVTNLTVCILGNVSPKLLHVILCLSHPTWPGDVSAICRVRTGYFAGVLFGVPKIRLQVVPNILPTAYRGHGDFKERVAWLYTTISATDPVLIEICTVWKPHHRR